MAGMSKPEPVRYELVGYGAEVVPLNRAPRWIPVSERLPEEDDYVLACYEGGFVRIAKLTPEEDDMIQCWHLDGGNDVTIKAFTHWMPLPKPPEVK